MPRIHSDVTIRLVNDEVGDIPKRYLRRKGVIVGRAPSQDEPGHRAYYVSFPGRKKPLCLYTDEMEVV